MQEGVGQVGSQGGSDAGQRAGSSMTAAVGAKRGVGGVVSRVMQDRRWGHAGQPVGSYRTAGGVRQGSA